MRLSPKPVFLGIVALGLPFALTVGWLLGTPAPASPPVGAPGGAGGIGAAPPKATTPTAGSVVDSPRAPRPVAARSSVADPPVSTLPSAVLTSAASSGSPPPELTLPPVPTPTAIVSTPPSPSATFPSSSVAPHTSQLNPVGLVRGA